MPVLVDAAQLAPHRPLPPDADFLAWSGHKMYAPFGAGVLVGPAAAFADGDPFLAGGGAVDLVDLDEVVWTAAARARGGRLAQRDRRRRARAPPSTRSSAIGWDAINAHDAALAGALRGGLAAIDGVRAARARPRATTLPVATFAVEGVPHALVAARLSAEFGIGVRHGCFCAHPYLIRLLDLAHDELRAFREDARRGDRAALPGAVRASAGISTTPGRRRPPARRRRGIAAGTAPPVAYVADPATGDFWPEGQLARTPEWDRSPAARRVSLL